jgi:hypothetical protein
MYKGAMNLPIFQILYPQQVIASLSGGFKVVGVIIPFGKINETTDSISGDLSESVRRASFL